MLVRFLPNLEDTSSTGVLFSEKSLNQLWHLTPGKIYRVVKVKHNTKSGIKAGQSDIFYTLINDINEEIELGRGNKDYIWFKPLSEEREEKINNILS